jgi:hypothetical protein
MADKKPKCLEWVGDKCVKWTEEDGKITATINFGQCNPKTKEQIEDTLKSTKGLRIKIREE